MANIKFNGNNMLFIGRVEEQKIFRNALLDLMRNNPASETLPYIFLLCGESGIGKTGLARRFEQMALTERPFKNQFEVLRLDWEKERQIDPDLINPETISPQIIYNTLYKALVRNELGQYINYYRDVKNYCLESEEAVIGILDRLNDRDDFILIRGVSTKALSRLIRLNIPLSGKKIKDLVVSFSKIGININGEQAVDICNNIQRILEANLLPEQYSHFFEADRLIGEALAKDIKNLSEELPLLIFMDDYDIVCEMDNWLRLLQRFSGPQTAWIISGQKDLVCSCRNEKKNYRGYIEDYPRRLIRLDLLRLSQDDVQDYFLKQAPGRKVNQVDVEALNRVTLGKPLAVYLAAELWKNDFKIEEIGKDAYFNGLKLTDVRVMVSRFFNIIFSENPEDRQFLLTLALADGDKDILEAMVKGIIPDSANVKKYLAEKKNRYAAIINEGYQLHHEISAYLIEDSIKLPERIRWLNSIAVDIWRLRIQKIEKDMVSIEARCQNVPWIIAVIRLSDLLFQLDEEDAWKFFIPHFVESIVYNPALTEHLLFVAQKWLNEMHSSGKNRLKRLLSIRQWLISTEEKTPYLEELESLDRLGWLNYGDGRTTERRAILALRRGIWNAGANKLDQALAAYNLAEIGLPVSGSILRNMLAEAMNNLAAKYLWPNGSRYSVVSLDAENLLNKVVTWFPKKGSAWYRYGIALQNNGNLRFALNAHLNATRFDPSCATFNELGNVYAALKNRQSDAVKAYRQAIDFDPETAYPHYGLGNVMYALSRYDEAVSEYHTAIRLDPGFSDPHIGLGNIYRLNGDYKNAILSYQQAIELAPKRFLPYHKLGNIYFIKRQFSFAEKYYQACVNLKSDTLLSDLVSLGIIKLYLNDETAAQQYFRQAIGLTRSIRSTPSRSRASSLINMATAHLCLAEEGEALATMQKAVDLLIVQKRNSPDKLPDELMDWLYASRFNLLREKNAPPAGLDRLMRLWDVAGLL